MEGIEDRSKEIVGRVVELMSSPITVEAMGFDKRISAVKKYFRQTTVVNEFQDAYGSEAGKLVEEIMDALEMEEAKIKVPKTKKKKKQHPLLSVKNIKDETTAFMDEAIIASVRGEADNVEKHKKEILSLAKSLQALDHDKGVDALVSTVEQLQIDLETPIFDDDSPLWEMLIEKVKPKPIVDVEVSSKGESDIDLNDLEDLDDLDFGSIEIAVEDEDEGEGEGEGEGEEFN